jgi:dTDP-4-amino-4,6-dideoxygalactose transaminase
MPVPFMDLSRMTAPLMDDINAALTEVIRRNAFILGDEVSAFESAFAAYCEAGQCVGLDNGSSALELALRAWGIGDGDEVITAPNSFIASASGIAFTGARPTFVDMDPIMALADQHGLKVLEDACQAHGARYKGRRCGSLGHAAAFSFYPAKNLGCFGDGGALTTNDAQTAETVRMLRNYGQKVKYEHVYIAYNRRLDTLQAAVLGVKLPHLDEWNASRRATAARYDAALAGKYQVPAVPDYSEPVYHLYVIRSPRRAELAVKLKAEGVDSGLHYPVAIHLQEAYKYLGHQRGDFPEAEKACDEVLSLPMFPYMTETEVEGVVEAVLTSTA